MFKEGSNAFQQMKQVRLSFRRVVIYEQWTDIVQLMDFWKAHQDAIIYGESSTPIPDRHRELQLIMVQRHTRYSVLSFLAY